MSDPGKQVFFREFFKQWLDFEELWTPPEPPPAWSETLLPDMLQESQLVFDDFAWGAGSNFLDVLTANYTYVTPALGEFYELAQATAGAQRVEFPVDHPRANTGILTHAALIGAKGDGDILAHRGKWLRSGFLCETGLEVPTALLDSLGDELEGLTYQQMLERRNTEAGCAGCHSLIDSVGVGFAQFDKTGHFDPSVNIADFGITPQLVGSSEPEFSSVAELATKLRAREEVASCIAERVFLYTQGREPASADACAVEAASVRFASSEYSFGQLLQGLVEAPQFRLRRVPSATASVATTEAQ
jgi:hypothetical protein